MFSANKCIRLTSICLQVLMQCNSKTVDKKAIRFKKCIVYKKSKIFTKFNFIVCAIKCML